MKMISLLFAVLVTVSTGVMAKENILPAGRIIIHGKSEDGLSLILKLSLRNDGKVTYLYGNRFYVNRTNWFDEEDALDNQGFFDTIPAGNFHGHCRNESWFTDCVIRIAFSDEEFTTLFIHFDMLIFQDNKWQYSGSILETHSDQGMTLYHKSFEF